MTADKWADIYAVKEVATAAVAAKRKRMKTKFLKRYVLGEGLPSFYYADQTVGLVESMERAFLINLEIAPELRDRDAPRYRLVLEKVKP